MSLRSKTVLFALLCISIIFTIWGLLANTLFLENFNELETDEIRADALRLHTALQNELDDLGALCADWAAWDDTYQFMQDHNPQYLASNWVDGTFANLELNLAVLYDVQGNILYQNVFDLDAQQSASVSSSDREYFRASQLTKRASVGTVTSVLSASGTPMLFCISPVLTSLDQGPQRGFLVFGRYLQGALFETLENSVDSEITISPYDPALIPAGSSLLPLDDESGAEIIVNKISDDIIEYDSLIRDYQGNPILIVKQVRSRDVYQRGLEGIRSLMLAVVLTGIIAEPLFLLLLDRSLLSRLSTLHDSVIALRQGNIDPAAISIQLPGSDEISRLSLEFDHTLHALIEKQNSINGFLHYSQLMLEISTRFINIPVSKIDQNLKETLSTIGKEIDADFAHILLLDNPNNPVIAQHFEWCKPDIGSLKTDFSNTNIKSFRWAFKKLSRGESIIFSSPQELPPSAAHERIFLQKHHISAAIGMPLSVADDWIGLIAFAVVERDSQWTDQIPVMLEIIAGIISSAIDRKRNELVLQSSHKYQYRLNQVTRTGIEKDNYNASIRSLSRNLRLLLNLDRHWLVMLDEAGKLQVYESGKKIVVEEEIIKVLETLMEMTSKDFYVHPGGGAGQRSNDAQLDQLGKSFIALPLAARNQHLGLIIFASDQPHQFNPLEKNICLQAATQISLAIIKNRSLEESRKISRELRSLRKAVVDFSSELHLAKLQDTILERAVKLLNAEGGEFLTYDEKNGELETVASMNMDRNYKGMRSKIGEGAVGKALAAKKTLWIRDYSAWPHRLPEYEGAKIKASLSSPLIAGEKMLGCISVFHYNPDFQFTSNDQHLLTIFAQHASIAIDNAMLFEQVQEIARTDEMTGLLNRRALFEIGSYEISRAIRLERPLAVAMMDLDNYKEVNDLHSHIVGDRVLKEVSRLLRENVRNIDIICRYGGDEYVIIMPETQPLEAVRAMERVRKKLQKAAFKVDGTIFHITACFGVTHHLRELPTLEKMIAEADKAMYAAKASGRNCLRVFQEL